MPEIDGHAVPAPTPPVYKPEDDGSGWFSNVTEAATRAANEMAQAATEVGSALRHSNSPGFAFDHDQLMSIAGRWDDLAAGFRDDQHIAQRFNQARPPGSEYASENNVKATTETGSLMKDAFLERSKYCEEQAAKFRKAAGEYQKADEKAKDSVSGSYTGIV